jgi:IS605 OrfB family transposase
MSKKAKGLETTYQVRLYPTPDQSRLLMAHCLEYISTVNVLVQAIDADMLDDGFSTKDFVAALPSAVKNQALRDAKSVYKRSLELGRLPVLKKPLVQWNNQNWHLDPGRLSLPVMIEGKTQQIQIRCAACERIGTPGILRIKKKRGKWIADITLTLKKPETSQEQGVMGVDLGIKVPAVSYVTRSGARFYGNGRNLRYMRRRFYARRKSLQKAGKKRALRKSQGKERRWMKHVNHQLSRQLIKQAQAQSVGVIKLEMLFGIRERTTRTSRGAKARKNNRMSNTWSFYQLAQFITYKAERLGITVERVDPAYTSQECPTCGAHNKARDRHYQCSECSWHGHRDIVGAVAISRRAGVSGDRIRATGA